MSSESGIFLRKASGLRRSASTSDVFIFNTGLISVGLAVALNAYYVPAFYPEANIAVSSLVATILMFLAGVGFYLWAVLMPRSGGNYIFLSRAIHPLVGFVISWLEVIVLLFYTAVAAALIVRIGFSTLLSGMGYTLGNSSLTAAGLQLSGTIPTFVLGSLVIVLSSILLVAGMKRFFIVQKMMFITAIAGTIALVIGIISLSGDVESRISSTFAGMSVQQLISQAQAAGWRLDSQTFIGSLAAIGWPLLPLAGGVLSIGIGAEVQRVQRSQLIGILGSILFSGAVFAFIGSLGDSAFSREFLGAVGFNSVNGVVSGVPGGVPWIPFLVSALSGNVLMALLIGAGFVAWIYLWIPGMLAYCNRSFLAWSLDRLGPEWLGTVSEKRQTPTRSSALGAVLAILFLAAYLWIPALQTLVVFQMLMFAWGISLLGGALFPFVRRGLFSAATADGAVITSRGIFSFLMALGSGALFYSGYVLWNDPVSAGHSPLALGIVAGVTILGLGLYFLAVWIRKKQGIEVWRSFREIPVE